MNRTRSFTFSEYGTRHVAIRRCKRRLTSLKSLRFFSGISFPKPPLRSNPATAGLTSFSPEILRGKCFRLPPPLPHAPQLPPLLKLWRTRWRTSRPWSFIYAPGVATPRPRPAAAGRQRSRDCYLRKSASICGSSAFPLRLCVFA
jgi:hypothetical protein